MDQVHDHMIIHGIVKVYDLWVYHEEMTELDALESNIDFIGDGPWDMLQELNNASLFNVWVAPFTSNITSGDVFMVLNGFAKLLHVRPTHGIWVQGIQVVLYR